MNLDPSPIQCDGCGLPASPDHIRARVERLVWATRFRPIHIDMLFVAREPMSRLEDDFYRPRPSQPFFAPLFAALNIVPEPGKQSREATGREADSSRLVEFQRRGYYLTYLSECPLPAQDDVKSARESISRLAPTLIKRIRFNYKPKRVAVLGNNLDPLIDLLREAGIGPLVDFNETASLTFLTSSSTGSSS
jgi:hypothetical protein